MANIVDVLTNPAERARLRTCLAPRRTLFSVERLMDTIREVVDEADRAAAAAGVPSV